MSGGAVGARAALLLAAPDDNIPPGKGPEWGKAAPIGLLIILLLGVALFFLIKNMNKQFRKVPASFDPPSDDGVESADPGNVDDPPDSSDPSDTVEDSGVVGDPSDRADDDAADPAAIGRTRSGGMEADGVASPPAGEPRG